MASSGSRKSLITGSLPRYRKLYDGERWQPGPGDDWNPNIPYGGKVFLARKKKPQSWLATIMEVIIIICVVGFCVYAYYYMDNLHFHALRAVAHTTGSANAQHFLGQRYLHGKGVDKDHKVAMHYFGKAAEQGHPHASHNLAVGHLKGMHQLPPGEAHRLIQHAAVHGIPEAQDALGNVCIDGGCD